MGLVAVPWRVHWRTSPPGRYQITRWAVRRGGRATPWPWTEVHVPRGGVLTLSRTRPV